MLLTELNRKTSLAWWQILALQFYDTICALLQSTATQHQYRRWIHFTQQRSEALKTINGPFDCTLSLSRERSLLRPLVYVWRILVSLLSNRSPLYWWKAWRRPIVQVTTGEETSQLQHTSHNNERAINSQGLAPSYWWNQHPDYGL